MHFSIRGTINSLNIRRLPFFGLIILLRTDTGSYIHLHTMYIPKPTQIIVE